jgi:SAM-dependent methyltransferase
VKLWQTRRHWEKFARVDPLWAVLSEPDKKGNRWQADAFFATGRELVASELGRVRALCPALRTGHALDFGCGVGRLTQALAGHFDRVTGVDVSAEMIRLAREHNRHGPRVTYVHNPHADLRGFDDGAFDFVYSLLTLQHVAPEYARGYIAEFVRVLAPGGVVLFQLPTRRPAPPRRTPHAWLVALALRAWRAANRLVALRPVMEMHAIPREEVVAHLRALGAEILDVHRYDPAGEMLESYGYIARKPGAV